MNKSAFQSPVYELVDGYHRYRVMLTSKRVYEREKGLLPVSVIRKSLAERMAFTIRHNRARGVHNVELMRGSGETWAWTRMSCSFLRIRSIPIFCDFRAENSPFLAIDGTVYVS